MGAHLPFRNMYHKGIYLILGQIHYYAPDENSGLFQWADHLPTVTFSLSPLRALSPSPTCPIPHPPCSYFNFFHAVIILCFCVLFHLVLPRFHFLPHVSAWLPFSRTHISAWFPPTANKNKQQKQKQKQKQQTHTHTHTHEKNTYSTAIKIPPNNRKKKS